MENRKIIFIIIAIVALVITCAGIYIYLNRKIDIEQTKKSVVLIYSYDSSGELVSSGSGFIAFKNDILITNAHVIEDSYRIEVISEDNIKYNVKGIIGYSTSKDIAIIKLDDYKDLKPLKINSNAKVGALVYAIGSPLGIKNTVSNGILSGNMQMDGMEVFQHTAPISPGSSGGALLNSKGAVLGITYASITDGQNINLAIPAKEVIKLYKKAIKIEPLELKYKDILKSKIMSYKNGINIFNGFKNLKFENLYLSNRELIDRDIPGKEKLKQIASLVGHNNEYEFIDSLTGKETDALGTCGIANLSGGANCISNSVNPKYSLLHIVIYEKENFSFDEFKEITNKFYASYFANLFVNYSKIENYEDDNFYYNVSYYNTDISKIRIFLNKDK